MPNIREAARTIILDEKQEKIAVLEVKNGDYHKIPGGGIENGESAEMAAIREALEEGACDVRLIEMIGEAKFTDPNDPNLFHHSVCFLAQKIKDHQTSYFTEEELANKFRLLWLSFEEAISLFEKVRSTVPFEIKMNNRDLNFIKIAKKHFSNRLK
ncbi:MAG: NUDIX domain-containing protein [Patescibacteria group bacterium]|jgi:ADP-ribose pyrophosphatase YjhB (NUDIX family)